SINIDPELCEITGIESVGTVNNYGYAVSLELTADQIINLTNTSEITLINIKIKAKQTGTAEFSIGNYLEIFRNNKLVEQSQIITVHSI
ncbi:MAG: hypothetical protein LBL39_03730, partial [Planctomycetaceae bacterium]|nr:hypothetical protein [Planctomycetaceae bacterium]